MFFLIMSQRVRASTTCLRRSINTVSVCMPPNHQFPSWSTCSMLITVMTFWFPSS
uniref:Uncharacterized protein n=1 Tax=Arundo donax TaxID=35708 RepID=A0A0A9BTQ4_ARUDO